MNILQNIKSNWKTSLSGVLVAVFTIMYCLEKINTEDYVTALGVIGTIIALLSKDSDKTGIKGQ